MSAAPAVRVLNQWDRPMAGVSVTFTVVEGDGDLAIAKATTGSDGIATSGSWRLGVAAGSNRVHAMASGLPPVTFTAEGRAGAASTIEIVSGDAQTGVVATRLVEPVAVRIVDAYGNAVPGVPVTFAPEGGSDAVVSSLSSTDENGMAIATWTTGTRSGVQRLTARAGGAGEVVFEALVMPGAATDAEFIAGAGQAVRVGEPVPDPPAVRVIDDWGNGIPSIEVRFEILAGGGTLGAAGTTGSEVVVITDGAGVAALDTWRLGQTAGTNAVRATAAGTTVQVSSTGTAGPAASVAIHTGDGQSAAPGSAVAVPPAVLVTDTWGNPVADITVSFAAESGGGTVTGEVAMTDARGLGAVGSWTLGSAGTNTLVASVAGAGSVAFTANATTSAGSGGSGGGTGGGSGGSGDGSYYMDVVFTGSITQSQKLEFFGAAGRWASVVTGDLPDVTINIPANACGMQHPAVTQTVDDLLVLVTVVPIDGAGGILGSAGPCLVRSAGGLPVVGAVRIDEADLAFLESNGRLGDVLAHEFGHVMGIGTRWGAHVVGAGGADPYFVGPAATSEFLGSGGSLYPGSPVPVENSGGPGTRDGHWRENIFDNELMTGWLDMSANPLSGITVGALEDIGYEVDFRNAEGFTIAVGGAAVQSMDAARERFELREATMPDPIAVDARGRRAPLVPFRR